MAGSRPTQQWISLPAGQQRRRLLGLVFVVTLQALVAAFFLFEVTADFIAKGWDVHTVSETAATVALLLGAFFGSHEMRRMVRRQNRTESALKMASGAFTELIEQRFAEWALSASERQVALLTIKGYDTPEIARMRGTAHGTVRAQLGSIYAKSGTTGRGQFVSLFIEELLETPVLEGAGDSSEA